MAQRSGLLACSDDVFWLILKQCEQHSIHQLSQTTKATRTRCLPQLYREVDLSSHNLGRLSEFEDELRLECWANTDDFHRPESLLSRQRSFLRVLVEHPNYATYVRSFSWTLIWYDEHEECGLSEIDYQLWKVLSGLVRVEKLDLAELPCPGNKHPEPYTHQIPPVLFPSVSDLRLTGWMPHKLVANIFSSINLSKLRTLSLDTLQEEGKYPDGTPMMEEINKQYWNSEWRAKLCKRYMEDPAATDFEIIFPGPMWLTFVPLIGKLHSLQRLEIRIPPLEENTLGEDGDCPDYECYVSVMAKLVASTETTLEALVIDYARQTRWKLSNCGTARNMTQTIQNRRLRRSEMLLRSILPLLWSSDEWKWKWKSLRSVSLKGFLSSFQLRIPFKMSAEIEAMQSKIGDFLSNTGVLFEWSDDSPRPGFLFLGHDFGVSELTMEQFDRLVKQLEQV